MYGIIICKYKHCLGYGYPKYSYAYGLPITAHNTVGRGYYSYPAAYSTQVQYTAPGYRGYYSYLAYSTQLPLQTPSKSIKIPTFCERKLQNSWKK